MKKSTVLTMIMVLMCSPIFANTFIDNIVNFRNEWIRPAVPVIMGIILIVWGVLNSGKVFSRDPDKKKEAYADLGSYLLYAVVLVAVAEALIGIATITS